MWLVVFKIKTNKHVHLLFTEKKNVITFLYLL